MAEINCEDKTTREINTSVKKLIDEGATDIVIRNPGARHNLGVGLVRPVTLTYEGSVGYYCSGMIDTPTVHIKGTAGWGLAASMLNGKVVVHANAGNGVAASIRRRNIVCDGQWRSPE